MGKVSHGAGVVVQQPCVGGQVERSAVYLCSVAAGRAGLYFELSVSLWDYAAGMLLVNEAGGRCCRTDGSPLPFDGTKTDIAAGSPRALADFLRLAGE